MRDDRGGVFEAIASALRVPDRNHSSWPTADVDAILASLRRHGYEIVRVTTPEVKP